MHDFRRSGQRDDRRRRVLHDEVLGRLAPAEDAPPEVSRSPRPARKPDSRYTEAAHMDAQPRLTDLIPRKISSLVLLFLAGLAAIAGLEFLYAWMPTWSALSTDGRVAAFDLDSEGSLGAWFSSLLLLASAGVALLVWSLRRHRVDDYHGRYRIWAWAACLWLVMSIDEACSLHEGFKEMMTHATTMRLAGDGSLWWVIAYVLVLAAVGIRLFLEMRSCRASTTALLLGACAWAVAVVTQLEWLLPRTGARGVMVEEGCEMGGDLLLLLAMVLHARYVIFEIEGLVGHEQPKTKRQRRLRHTGTDDLSPTQAAKAPAEPLAKPSGQTAASVNRPAAQPAALTRVDPSEESAGGRKLSRAERRALKRQQRG